MSLEQCLELRHRGVHADIALELASQGHWNARALGREIAWMKVDDHREVALRELREASFDTPKWQEPHVAATRETQTTPRDAHDTEWKFRHHST